MLRRIEKDAIKINVHGKTIYLKKGGLFGLFKEWRVIYPPVNPETKEWDRINLYFGGRGNAFKTFIIGVLIMMVLYGAWSLINSYNEVLGHPVVQACINASQITLGG